jgi:transcriptional regulator GlxA family with amidase domain
LIAVVKTLPPAIKAWRIAFCLVVQANSQTPRDDNRPPNVIQNPKNIAATHRQQFDNLCLWIDAHIDEVIGWQQLMEQSGLDFQTLQTLFFQYKSTTPMTWIRRRREGAKSKLT